MATVFVSSFLSIFRNSSDLEKEKERERELLYKVIFYDLEGGRQSESNKWEMLALIKPNNISSLNKLLSKFISWI